jgi:multidrug resistance protein
MALRSPLAQQHVAEANEAAPLLVKQDDELENPEVVDWTNEDLEHPYNWPRWQALSNCLLVSAMTFLTALASCTSLGLALYTSSQSSLSYVTSAIIAPGVPQLMAEFRTQNLQLATFVVSVYILGFAAGPLVIAPLSELYGRVPVYHVCNMGFTVFAVACALAPNMHCLVAFRFLNGVFGSCPATIGGGSITDMIPQERRASVIAAYSIGALFAPIMGPIVGGLLAQAMGWRWDFWLLAISGAFFLVLQLVVLRETYHPVLLERKVVKMREATGKRQLRSVLDTGLSPGAYFLRNLIRPVKMLTRSPIVIIVSLFIAITYGYMCKSGRTLVLEGADAE